MKPNQIVRLGVLAVVVAAVAVVLRLKQVDSSSPVEASPVEAAPADEPPVEVALPRLLDLGADKCIPCKKMAPILEALREDYAGEFEVVFIDVWKDRQAAGPYGIKLIPTQIFFDEEGDELFRHEGFFSREDILATWSSLGYAFGASPDDAPG
jgi:thioredoxin 1